MVDEGITMDFPIKDLGDAERTITTILSTLTQMNHLISNHLGSHIDPNAKAISGKAKTPQQVDVTRMAMKPLTEAQEKKAGSLYKNRQMPTKDYTGRGISKEDIDSIVEEDMEEYIKRNPEERGKDRMHNDDDEEKVLIALTRFGDDEEKLNPAFMAASALTDEKKAMANPLSTSEGKALLTALNEAANKLRKFLSTTRVDGGQAQMPQDMR
jgi:hypothetical protein